MTAAAVVIVVIYAWRGRWRRAEAVVGIYGVLYIAFSAWREGGTGAFGTLLFVAMSWAVLSFFRCRASGGRASGGMTGQ